MNKDLIKTFFRLCLLLAVTTTLFLYVYGVRINKPAQDPVNLTQTGMVSAKSIPTSGSVYLDDNLMTATDDTISGITPGIHKIRIIKNGFTQWEKQIEVFPELVTDITAILIAQSPRLEPLTTTGAKNPAISPTLTKLAFFSQDSEKPGVWVIPLTQTGITLFKSNPNIVLLDTKLTKYSEGQTIEWSPDEEDLIIQGPNNIYYLVNLATGVAEAIANPEQIKQDWQTKLTAKRQDFINKLDIPDNIKQLAISKQAIWSPDEKKFLYTNQNGEDLEYKVYNLEKPIPVGEKVETTVFITKTKALQPAVSWYSDSFHLVMVEGDVTKDQKGLISLIRIDGTNKTELYNSVLHSNKVFSTPSGDKVIIWTSFKSNDKSDLYTLSIR